MKVVINTQTKKAILIGEIEGDEDLYMINDLYKEFEVEFAGQELNDIPETNKSVNSYGVEVGEVVQSGDYLFRVVGFKGNFVELTPANHVKLYTPEEFTNNYKKSDGTKDKY